MTRAAVPLAFNGARMFMEFNWEDALGEIVVGYSRKPSLNRYAPRHRDCAAGDDCDARKLITLGAECARVERLRGEPQVAAQVFETSLLDCRRDLDSSLDYVAEDWRDDFELNDDHLDERLEEVDPAIFAEEQERRHRLEEEYLNYHREFRARKRRIPDPGWRGEYVEEVVNLGYETLLGD